MFLYALTFLVIFNVIIQDTVQAVLPSASNDPSAPACDKNTRNIVKDEVCQMMKKNGRCGMLGMEITCQKTCVCNM